MFEPGVDCFPWTCTVRVSNSFEVTGLKVPPTGGSFGLLPARSNGKTAKKTGATPVREASRGTDGLGLSPDALGPVGLLILTGGEGRRMGAPKDSQFHPEGGTWAGYLVRVFEEVFPKGPIRILGKPVSERSELENFEDSRQGPARALAAWAAATPPMVLRWWVLACDQVRWTPLALEAWFAVAVAADPEAQAWVLAQHDTHTQYLGGFLGSTLIPAIAHSSAKSLRGLAEELPTVILPSSGPGWLDIDSPEDLKSWRS